MNYHNELQRSVAILILLEFKKKVFLNAQNQDATYELILKEQICQFFQQDPNFLTECVVSIISLAIEECNHRDIAKTNDDLLKVIKENKKWLYEVPKNCYLSITSKKK